jgi:hypothetical protein
MEAKWEKGEILIPLAAGTKQQPSDRSSSYHQSIRQVLRIMACFTKPDTLQEVWLAPGKYGTVQESMARSKKYGTLLTMPMH